MNWQLLTRLVVSVTLIAAYVVVTVTGHDGSVLLGLIVGYIGGATVDTVAAKASP